MSVDPDQRRKDLRGIARAIASEVGQERMRLLHRESRLLDVLTLVGLWAVVGTLFYLLGTLSFGVLWLGLFVLQGFMLQCLGFCAHDLFVHRRLGGDRIWRILANVCLLPLVIPATDYAVSHFDHHWYLGTARDGESYKEDFDRRWVKWIYLIGPGTLAVAYRLFRRRDAAPLVQPERSDETVAQIRLETRLMLGFMALVAVAMFFWPRMVLAGYVLPAVLALPFASALRVILEHGEMSMENPYHAATCYVAGLLTGPLFLWGIGDAHLIHHLFPNIPYYRVGEARALMLPILLRQGVIRRTSLPWLIGQWFVRNRRHGTVWS